MSMRYLYMFRSRTIKPKTMSRQNPKINNHNDNSDYEKLSALQLIINSSTIHDINEYDANTRNETKSDYTTKSELAQLMSPDEWMCDV